MSSFVISTQTFQTMMSKAVKGASNSKFNALTSMVNVVVSGGSISVTTTDSENYLTIMDKVVSGDDTVFTVDVDLLTKLVSKTSSENIKVTVSDDVITLVGNGTYKLPIRMDVDGTPIKYPEHTITEPTKTGTIKTSVFKDILLHNKPSVAITYELPVLTGYMFTEDSVVTADTLNICVNKMNTFGTNVLLSNFVLELLTLCESEEINYTIGELNILFETDKLKLFARIMPDADQYPLDKVLPYMDNSYTSHCTLSKSNMISIIDRLCLFIKDNEDEGVYLTFTKDNLKIEPVNHNGIETLAYQGISNFKDYVCFVGTDQLKKQILGRAGESFELYFGNDTTIMIKEDNVSQIMALMVSDDAQED